MGLFNTSHMFLGTEAMGGGHGDMRNKGGMHEKYTRNMKKGVPPPVGGVSYEYFLKQQDAAKRIQKAAKNSPALTRKAKSAGQASRMHAGVVAPLIDSGNGRKTRMIVAVRCRPLSVKEANKGNTNVIDIDDARNVYANDPDDKMGGIDYLRLNVTKDKAYTFDHAFGPDSTNEEVYGKTMRGVVRAVMQGFHGSCFAYGATGSGKTYTMTGSAEQPGIMPRAIGELFSVAQREDDFKWRFSLTYIEIYNERCKDLLNPNSGELDVREDPKKGNVVAGAVEVGVTSLQQIMELMDRGTMYRTTEATNCNEVSSRSHAILQVICTGIEKYGRERTAKQQTARLSMIDLAGSERAYKTDNSGQRLREGRNINRSLLSLANCINALADKSKKNQHIPYRDSKLTRLLRDSLAGTSVSTMLCAISPASSQFEETLNTLKYANRAKEITPPDKLKKQVREYNPVEEQVEVLKELKESLIPIMKKMVTPKPSLNEKKKARVDHDIRPTKNDVQVEKQSRKPGSPRQMELVGGGPAISKMHRHERLSLQGEMAVGLAKEAAEHGNVPMAEVRKVLAELVDEEPQAKANPSVQAAYVALDNMEAEELEAVSAESSLLWKEQQNLLRDLAKSKHAHKIAAVRLSWYDAAAEHGTEPGEQQVGGGKEALEELLERVAVEEMNISRLDAELRENKAALEQLQAEIPTRVVSSHRLHQLTLTMKHQQAMTECVRFRQQSRSKLGLLAEILTVWNSVVPHDLQELFREVFDLRESMQPICGKGTSTASRHRLSIDTLRQMTLESHRANETVQLDETHTDDDEDEPHLVDSECLTTPWRSLGGLASKIAMQDDAVDRRNDDIAVVRKAQEELKDARSKRLSVMKFVEDATTPKELGGRAKSTNKVEPTSQSQWCPASISLSRASEHTNDAAPASPRNKRSLPAHRRVQENIPPSESDARYVKSRPTSARGSKVLRASSSSRGALKPSNRSHTKAR